MKKSVSLFLSLVMLCSLLVIAPSAEERLENALPSPNTSSENTAPPTDEEPVPETSPGAAANETAAEPDQILNEAGQIEAALYSKFNMTNAINCSGFENIPLSFDSATSYIAIKWTAPNISSDTANDISYIIETAGNLDTKIDFVSSSGVSSKTVSSGGLGGNASADFGTMMRGTRYFVISLESGEPGSFLLRFKRHDHYSIDQEDTNFDDEIQAQLEAGNPTPTNTLLQYPLIDYELDVDWFAFEARALGKYRINITNLDDIDLKVTVYGSDQQPDSTGYDSKWQEHTFTRLHSSPVTYSDFQASINTERIYVKVEASNYNSHDKDSNYGYMIEFMTPDRLDPYDAASESGNDIPAQATLLDFDSSSTVVIDDATLHIDDEDIYKFTTGLNGGTVSATIYKMDGQYLYTANIIGEDYEILATSTGTSVLQKTATATNLAPNTTYYIQICSRNANNVYDPFTPYKLIVEDSTGPRPNTSWQHAQLTSFTNGTATISGSSPTAGINNLWYKLTGNGDGIYSVDCTTAASCNITFYTFVNNELNESAKEPHNIESNSFEIELSSSETYYVKVSPPYPADNFVFNINATADVQIFYTDVDAGYSHTVILANTGKVYTTGDNWFGQCGLGASIFETGTFTEVVGLSDVVDIAAGDYFTVAVKNDGTVWAFGYNNFGQLGTSPQQFDRSHTPVLVPNLGDVQSAECGGNFVIAKKNDGTLWSWGDNSCGQLGIGSDAAFVYSPTQIPAIPEMTSVAAGSWHAIACNAEKIYTWGSIDNGNNVSNTPVEVQIDNSIYSPIRVAAGVNFSIVTDGWNTYSWGDNYYGQLGDGTTTSRYTPSLIPSTYEFVALSAGYDYVIASTHAVEGKIVVGWGDNSDGQLQNELSAVLIPTQIGTYSNVSEHIGAGGQHIVILYDNGTIETWGDNSSGQLGNGTVGNS